jgi:hypothetical protein
MIIWGVRQSRNYRNVHSACWREVAYAAEGHKPTRGQTFLFGCNGMTVWDQSSRVHTQLHTRRWENTPVEGDAGREGDPFLNLLTLVVLLVECLRQLSDPYEITRSNE